MTYTPQAADFLGQKPPARIIGTETECNIQLLNNHDQYQYISEDAIEAAGFISVGGYINNGMRVYPDVGHLEIDTAEALGPRQAAAANFASLNVLSRIVDASGLPHNGLHSHSGTIIKNTERSSGRHENYLFPRSIADSKHFDTIMASFLTSRVYAMSGAVGKGFQLSQKVKGIGDPAITRSVERRTTHGQKPMGMIPPISSDADTIGNRDWARLEVRYADGGFSRTASFLGYAATSLGLRLIEHEGLVDFDTLSRFSFKKHAPTARLFNSDLSFSSVAETLDGSHITAIDFQELLATAALGLKDKVELPEDEQLGLALWLDVCDQLRKADLERDQYGKLLSILDFAPRHRYLNKRFSVNELNSTNPRAVEANLTWDRLLPVGGGITYWSKVPSQYISDQEITCLEKNPPPTRAAARAAFINERPNDIASINWSGITFDDGASVRLSDSYRAKT